MFAVLWLGFFLGIIVTTTHNLTAVLHVVLVCEMIFMCSASTLLVGWWEGHPSCKNGVVRY